MASALAQLAAAGGTEPVSVPLADTQVRVKPPMDWKASAFEALREARFSVWAQTSLVNDAEIDDDGKKSGSDDVAVWNKVDPTVRQVAEFLAAYSELVGISLGE